MKKSTTKKPAMKADKLDKGMTAKTDKLDAAKDKKSGIKENSKKDVTIDSTFQVKKLMAAKGKK